MDIASIVLGGVLLLCAWLPMGSFVASLGAFVGLILGVVSYRRKSALGLPTTVAVIGIILCGITLALGMSCSCVHVLGAAGSR